MSRLIGGLAVAFATCACGGSSSPAGPTASTTSKAELSIVIDLSTIDFFKPDPGVWSDCTSNGECLLSLSIQNIGAGCASGTTVVVRFFDSANRVVGPDLHLEAPGGLSSKVIQ